MNLEDFFDKEISVWVNEEVSESLYKYAKSALEAFVQENFTGPHLSQPILDLDSTDPQREFFFDALSVEGEGVYHLMKLPRFLFFAVKAFEKLKKDDENALVMYIKAKFLQQRAIGNPCGSLQEDLYTGLKNGRIILRVIIVCII